MQQTMMQSQKPMRNMYFGWLLIAASIATAQPANDPGSVTRRVSQTYRALKTFRIEAETHILMTRNGLSGTLQRKTLLLAGNKGEFLVRQDDGSVIEVRASDGKTTWKALPRQKVWSKQEVSQWVNSDNDDDDTQANADPAKMGQDLFMQIQSGFVRRYAGMERYAASAQIEKETKVKWNGAKAECFVLHIVTGESDNRLFVEKNTYFVVRHIENIKGKANESIQIAIDYKTVDRTPPPPGAFDFAEASSGKQVAEVSLPSERNVSLVGQHAADFTLNDLGGTRVHLAELQGKPVLLDFWATWCPPCRRELPIIESLSRRYAGKLAVYGINDEDAKIAKRYLDAHHPELATLHDEKAKVAHTYGCSSIPTVIILDRTGKVIAHFIGTREESDLVAALKQAGLE